MVWNKVFLALVIGMNAMNTLEERIKKVMEEEVAVVPYHSDWPRMFELEKNHLFSCLPHDLLRRIEHFGSTAVPNLSSKPIIDMLVEVTSLEETKNRIVPILTFQGYEYFWRPTWGDDVPPYYAWFIKRDSQGHRTHHIHMVEHDFEHWDRLLFRDYLIEHPDSVKEYEIIKVRLAENFPNDRVTYTEAKTEFIVKVTQLAKRHYNQG
jgi:GrpB-like predicted nucleotidyltransferase (UPF0157 family)